MFLISGIAADLIGKLDPEASTPGEKLEVARALAGASDLPTANWLATAAEQQSTNLREKIAAGAMIADIAFRLAMSQAVAIRTGGLSARSKFRRTNWTRLVFGTSKRFSLRWNGPRMSCSSP